MKDTVIKGTGNSRYLKSAIPADITHAQLVELLRNGTFPFDFNGVNQGGITQLGDPLNKASLLKDATAALYGKGADAVPDDVLAVLSKAILIGGDGYTDVNGVAAPQVKIKKGTYVGTGTYGSGSPCVLNLGGNPMLLVVAKPDSGLRPYRENAWFDCAFWHAGCDASIIYSQPSSAPAHFSASATSISWYSTNAALQLNQAGVTYAYFSVAG